jgi:hypothetical protein
MFFDLSDKDSRLGDKNLARMSYILAKQPVRSFDPEHFKKHRGSFSCATST